MFVCDLQLFHQILNSEWLSAQLMRLQPSSFPHSTGHDGFWNTPYRRQVIRKLKKLFFTGSLQLNYGDFFTGSWRLNYGTTVYFKTDHYSLWNNADKIKSLQVRVRNQTHKISVTCEQFINFVMNVL